MVLDFVQSNLCNLKLWCKLQEFLFHISCYQNLRYQFDTKLHLVRDDQWKPHQNQLNMNLFLKWLNYKFRIRIGTRMARIFMNLQWKRNYIPISPAQNWMAVFNEKCCWHSLSRTGTFWTACKVSVAAPNVWKFWNDEKFCRKIRI